MFTTLRRRDKYPPEGTLIKIETPTRFFYAFIVFKTKIKLSDASTPLLTFDTGEATRSGAFYLLNSFYRKAVRMDEKFTLLLLVKQDTGLEQTKLEGGNNVV